MPKGTFVRVKADSDFRAGQDGMVMSPLDEEGDVGLMFFHDRYGVAGRTSLITGGSYITPCVGTEAWHISELDLDSIET